MIQLLYTLLISQMIFITIFVFKTPFRKLIIMGLDRLKRGSGPIVVKTVSGTFFVVMGSSVYNYVRIKRSGGKDGEINPTDQILMANYLLEASLMGFSLFLALMIDRLHYYIRELRLRRKSMEAVKKQSQSFEDTRNGVAKEIKSLEEEATNLKDKIKQLQMDLETKSKEAKNADANAIALRKQSEGFLLEYDRLLEENQILRDQLQSLDRRLSRSDIKKSL